MQMQAHIELLYFEREVKLFISIVKNVPEEIKEFVENKNTKANIF